MQVFRSATIVAPLSRRPVSARKLRMWCTPELILGVTTLTDEQALLPHIINQARCSGARIILAHVQSTQGAQVCRKTSLQRRTNGASDAHEALDRMARQLRWLGFACEPVLLSGPPELEIPCLVRSHGVDRVVIGFDEDPDLTTRDVFPITQGVLGGVDVPVCAIGRNALHPSDMAIRNITLAVSSEPNCEVALSFACRLAQEHRARLNVLHVTSRTSDSGEAATANSVTAKLPFTTWREAQLFCPTEIVVREGDPADEILSYCSSTRQDLIILCSPGDARITEPWRNGVSYRTIAGARCPVFVARRESTAALSVDAPAALTTNKFSPHRERRSGAEEGRQISTKAQK